MAKRNELNKAIFQDEAEARMWLEAHLWPHGAVCPKCGTVGNSSPIKTRDGWYQCNEAACRGQFTVTVGTLFERSHIPLNKWLMVAFLMCASKKGMSALQISRMVGVSYKSTWFMCHRLREAMRDMKPSRLGGLGKTVESDETYVGGKEKNKHARKRTGDRGFAGTTKEAVFSLVERDGRVRSNHMSDGVTASTLREKLNEQLAWGSTLYTDANPQSTGAGKKWKHESVNHSAGEYVRGDASTNTIESYFAILKRGIYGTYHHVSAQHLKRYLGEFDFRYNERTALGVNDAERTSKALAGIVGKRLTYRRTRREGAEV